MTDAELREHLFAQGLDAEAVARVMSARARRVRRSEVLGERACAGCGEVLSLAEFVRNAAKPLGRDYRCRPCHATRERLRVARPVPNPGPLPR